MISMRCWPVLLALVLTTLAFAGDDPWTKPDEAAKKRGSVLVVVVAGDESDEVKAAAKLLADKSVAKTPPVAVHVPDDEAAKKLGASPSPGKKEKVYFLDGYGLVVSRHESVPAKDGFARALKEAEDATAKKKKLEKTLDAAVAKAETARKKSDTKTACEQLLLVLEHKATVPCAAVDKAQKEADALAEEGRHLLEKARTEIENANFNEAAKLIAQATNDYPLPSVVDEARTVKGELRKAIDEQK